MKTALGILLTFFISTQLNAATTATAKLESRSNSKTSGNINFAQTADGLQLTYKIVGLTPNSSFGFHIHEKGDCSSPDAKSAGSHFHKIADTGGTSIESSAAFAGDLPQIKSNAGGVAEGTFKSSNVSLNNENSVDGLAIIIHAGPDDVSKPSAPRIACGLIKSVKK